MPTSLAIVRKFFPEVESVTDGKKPVHVEVTKKDSQSSAVKNHKACAMAVACKRKFNLDGVVISVGRAYLIKGNKATRYKLPESASREVVSFDRNGGFAEGEYALSVVPPNITKTDKRKGDRHGENNDYKATFRHMTDGIRTSLGSKNAV